MINTEEVFELIDSLRIRAEIRQRAVGRKSVQENKPDRLSLQLNAAADTLELLMYERNRLDLDDSTVYE